jgi:hypothetical protein
MRLVACEAVQLLDEFWLLAALRRLMRSLLDHVAGSKSPTETRIDSDLTAKWLCRQLLLSQSGQQHRSKRC